jgi:hypothetical protein
LYYVDREYDTDNNRTRIILRHSENEKYDLTLLYEKGDYRVLRAEFSEDKTDKDFLQLTITISNNKGEYKRTYRFNKNILTT